MRNFFMGYILSPTTGHNGSQMAIEESDKVSVFKPVNFQNNILTIVCENGGTQHTNIEIDGISHHLSYTGATYIELEFSDGPPEMIDINGEDHEIIWKK